MSMDEHYEKMAELLRHEKQMESVAAMKAPQPPGFPAHYHAVIEAVKTGEISSQQAKAILQASGVGNPANWNTGGMSGEAMAKEPDQSEMLWPSESGRMRSRKPPPNAWHRFWWRFLLGVKWRDLRPENKMDDLRRLG